MRNAVPTPVEEQVAERALSGRRAQYASEVRKLVDAALRVMQRDGSVDPQVRDIVREAGLSNQAFYRHFASKDALLLTVLAAGRARLVAYLTRRLAATDDPAERVRRFVDGILAQARNPEAARATRPFAIDGNRLAAQYPQEVAASRTALLDLLSPAVGALGGDPLDVELVHDLAMSRMHEALVQRRRPAPDEVERIVQFALVGIGGGRIGGERIGGERIGGERIGGERIGGEHGT